MLIFIAEAGNRAKFIIFVWTLAKTIILFHKFNTSLFLTNIKRDAEFCIIGFSTHAKLVRYNEMFRKTHELQ